ncbi:MAG: hypothetical protein LBQ74_03170 [Prevotella sp.]|nr:hypothetical protein [Prevotella sp.]
MEVTSVRLLPCSVIISASELSVIAVTVSFAVVTRLTEGGPYDASWSSYPSLYVTTSLHAAARKTSPANIIEYVIFIIFISVCIFRS